MSYSDEVLADAPLAYYRLGEASGTTLVDSSGNGRDGAIDAGVTLGAAGILPNLAGTAWQIDAPEGGNVPGAAWMAPATALTAEVWVRLSSLTSGVLMARSDPNGAGQAQKAWSIQIDTSGRVLGRVYNDAGASVVPTSATGVIAPNATYHVVLVQDGVTAAYYVNGVQVASASLSGIPVQWAKNTKPLTIARGDTTVYQIAGVVQAAAFYGTALSAARIAAHYQAAMTAPPAGQSLGAVQFSSTTGLVADIGVAAPVSSALGVVAFTSTTTLNLVGLGTPGSLTASFTSTTAFIAEATPAKDLGGDFRSTSAMDFQLDLYEVLDPITGTKPYRVVGVDMYGQQQFEVENATLGPIKWSINDKGSFSFTAPADDPKVNEVSVPEQEVQVWRGGRLIWWGVVTRARSTPERVEFQCQTLEWYFDRRLVGPVPRVGVFKGTHLEYQAGVWKPNFLPGSQPARLPVSSLSSEQTIAGSKSLALSASGGRETRVRSADDWFTTANGATLSGTGNTQLDNIVGETFGPAPYITVNVYHDDQDDWKDAKEKTQARWDSIVERIQQTKPDARVSGQGMGQQNPVATNSTVAGRAENRRVEITFRNDDAKKGHAQFVSQSYEVKVPTSSPHRLKATMRAWVYVEQFEAPAANNWCVMIERQDKSKPHKNPKMAEAGFKKVYARKYVPLTKASPQGKWIRMEASLMIPKDGKTYVIEGRLFPPSGLAYFDEADVYFEDSLDYQNEEQAHIIRDLIDHAQDESLGKTDLNIGRVIRKTGVKRTRRYFYSERTMVGEHLAEFTTLGDGVEWEVKITPQKRWIVSYFPRKERKTNYMLALGGNVAGFDVDVDGEQTSNVVVIMANEVETYAREERAAVDMSLLEGITMEMAYMATPGTPVSSLNAQARRGLERYRKPTTIPVLHCNPAYTNEIMRNVQTGDVIPVDVRSGWFQTVTDYRILDMTLDPQSERVSFTLMPEDAPIKVLSKWGSKWRYKSQPQTNSTGAQNGSPKETDKAWAARDYDDSSWTEGNGGFGWYEDGTDFSQQPALEPTTTIPVEHEVWIRKTIMCTEEMYVAVRADAFAFVYVNGTLIRDGVIHGTQFNSKFVYRQNRVPDSLLDPSGAQVVAIHVQDRLSDRPERPSALYADAKVRGIFNPDHVGV